MNRAVSIICICMAAVFSCSQWTSSKVKRALINIPEKDRQALSEFFQSLIIETSFGYTLLGEKPLTIEYYEEEPTCSELIGEDLCFFYPLEHWKVWQKYSYLFKSSRFLLRMEKRKGLLDEEYKELYFAHKPSFKKNLNDEEIWQQIDSLFTRPMDVAYHKNLGELLGYGKNNSLCFARMCELEVILAAYPHAPEKMPSDFQLLSESALLQFKYSKMYPKGEIVVQRESELKDLIKEYISLKERFVLSSSIYNEDPLNIVPLPFFMMDPSTIESKELMKRYKKTQKKLSLLLQDKEFLVKVLELYCQ